MFIREDLEEVIKNQFKVETFSYKKISKNNFNNCYSFIFDTNKGTIVIEIRPSKIYCIYEIKKISKFPGYSFKIKTQFSSLYTLDGETCLRINGVVTKFPGEAFDFTQELVLLALEEK